ncbi:MAG: peptidylprolyl isomerase [Dysgonamonadaceae bacterium]|jgi:peptidyl-prolyl cis-trans isomerase SurA|nr:peptidylprolyl isomerase [Dysgonamonadaceae bacterium]
MKSKNLKKNLISLVLLLSAGALFAQTSDPVVMKINGKNVKKSEFEYIYNKNNGEEAIDKRSLDEYITLFRNFKLKVAEAEAQGIDTTAAFQTELNEYRTQLAQPYLETEKNEQLVREAYERSKESSEVSAILIAFAEGGQVTPILPADTLAAYQKAMEVWKKANQGADFETLVKEYSNDERSKQNERPGYIGWLSPANLIPVLELPLCLTPAGKIAAPVRSSVGYYLLKIHDKKANPETSYDDLRPQLENKLERTGSFAQLHQPGIDQWKTDHQYAPNANAYRALLETANRVHPFDSLYTATFANNQETLFTIDQQPVPVAGFIRYLKNNPQAYVNLSTEYLADKFNDFVYQQLKEAENSQLENQYPEFKNLMQEYRDGILLFEVSNREVWEKASNDTVGLTQYFETHKSQYAWNEPHWKGYVVLLKNAKAKKGIQKEIRKMEPGTAVHYLLNKYNTADTTLIQAEKGLFVKGQNPYVDEAVFGGDKAPLSAPYTDFILLGKTLPDMPEEYADVKGLVITDYQDYLEQEWVKSLNEKYPVEIYKDVIAKEIK